MPCQPQVGVEGTRVFVVMWHFWDDTKLHSAPLVPGGSFWRGDVDVGLRSPGGIFCGVNKKLGAMTAKKPRNKKMSSPYCLHKVYIYFFFHDCYELHLQYMVHNVLDIQYTCSIWMLIYRTLAKYTYPIILQPFHSSPPTRRWRDTTPSSTEVSLHVQVPSRCEPQLGTCTVGNSHRGQLQSQKESNPFREPKLV